QVAGREAPREEVLARSAGDVDERAVELELGRQPRASLCRRVELSEPHDGDRELVGGEVRRLSERLLGHERMHLELARRIPRAHALVGKTLDTAHAPDVTDE